LPWRALAQAGDDRAVDGQLDDAVLGLDAVMVPFVGALAVLLGRQTARPAQRMRPVRNALGAPDAEEIALAGGGHGAGLLVPIGMDRSICSATLVLTEMRAA